MAREHVADGVVAHVPHVQLARRIGEHRQAIELGLGGILGSWLRRAERAPRFPEFLGLEFDALRFVLLSHSGSAQVAQKMELYGARRRDRRARLNEQPHSTSHGPSGSAGCRSFLGGSGEPSYGCAPGNCNLALLASSIAISRILSFSLGQPTMFACRRSSFGAAATSNFRARTSVASMSARARGDSLRTAPACSRPSRHTPSTVIPSIRKTDSSRFSGGSNARHLTRPAVLANNLSENRNLARDSLSATCAERAPSGSRDATEKPSNLFRKRIIEK